MQRHDTARHKFPREVLGRKDCELDPSAVFHIGYGVNENYLRYAGISMTSILLNNIDSQFAFHLIVDSLSDQDRRLLSQLAQEHNSQINIYRVPAGARQQLEAIAKFQYREDQPKAAYYRLFLPHILEGRINRVLYLDADVFCNHVITGLMQLQFENHICAVVDDLPDYVRNKKLQLPFTSERYFNSGVMLIDIQRWLAAQVSEQVNEYLLQNRTTTFDQDALNVVLAEKTFTVDSKWNFLKQKVLHDGDIPEQVALIHYIGGEKPWHYPYPNRADSYFDQYARRSLWQNRYMETPHTYMMWREVVRMWGRQGLFKIRRLFTGGES